MQAMTVGFLGNLLAATEAVGDDQPVSRRLPHCRKKFELADGPRDFVLVLLEAERASHAAASRSRRRELDAHALQDGFFGGHLHDGLVMAMAVDQSAALE